MEKKYRNVLVISCVVLCIITSIIITDFFFTKKEAILTKYNKKNIETYECYVTDYGDSYHAGSCGYLHSSSHKTTVFEAKIKGYISCAKCKPSVSTTITVFIGVPEVTQIKSRNFVPGILISVFFCVAFYISIYRLCTKYSKSSSKNNSSDTQKNISAQTIQAQNANNTSRQDTNKISKINIPKKQVLINRANEIIEILVEHISKVKKQNGPKVSVNRKNYKNNDPIEELEEYKQLAETAEELEVVSRYLSLKKELNKLYNSENTINDDKINTLREELKRIQSSKEFTEIQTRSRRRVIDSMIERDRIHRERIMQIDDLYRELRVILFSLADTLACSYCYAKTILFNLTDNDVLERSTLMLWLLHSSKSMPSKASVKEMIGNIKQDNVSINEKLCKAVFEIIVCQSNNLNREAYQEIIDKYYSEIIREIDTALSKGKNFSKYEGDIVYNTAYKIVTSYI